MQSVQELITSVRGIADAYAANPDTYQGVMAAAADSTTLLKTVFDALAAGKPADVHAAMDKLTQWADVNASLLQSAAMRDELTRNDSTQTVDEVLNVIGKVLAVAVPIGLKVGPIIAALA